MRPYILIDVDFTLNPDFSGTWELPEGDDLRKAGWVIIEGFAMNARPVWLNRLHGVKLLHASEATGAKLAWATRWHDYANQVISPLLGLPQLPVIPCTGDDKTGSVFSWLDERKIHDFAWLDDEQYVIDACKGSGIKAGPATGLTDENFEQAAELLGMTSQ